MGHAGAVIGRKQPPGTDWRRLGPIATGDVRATVETSFGVGGGASASAFVGVRPSNHSRRHAAKWMPAGETHIYGAAGYSSSIEPLNLILEANGTVNIPVRTSAGPVRRSVDQGLKAVAKAQKALQTGKLQEARSMVQELTGLRNQTRTEAYQAGGLKAMVRPR
jgi:hypothetical protein